MRYLYSLHGRNIEPQWGLTRGSGGGAGHRGRASTLGRDWLQPEEVGQ